MSVLRLLLQCNRAFHKNGKNQKILSIGPIRNYPEKVLLGGVEVISLWWGRRGFVKAHFQGYTIEE